ncbi:hypothetical protein ACFYRC_29860 [Streptomyces sp. NPDC005279]|uniref:hypothetical protein n=1 Tax=Streptomyces sp. NPDC005279 TaxID=3364712 RepID=UPI0036899E5B
MSNDAYIEKFGAKKAIAGGLPVSRKEGITAAYNGNADRHPRPTRYEYDAVVATSQGGIRLTVTSVAEQGTYGPGPTGPHTPDGRPIGTVTVFCRGQTVCPDWVNDL